MNFSYTHYKAVALVALCSLSSVSLKAACPTPCAGVTGAAQFCSLVTQNLCVTGNEQIGGNLTVCGTETIFSTAPSTGCTSGALVVAGGVGVGGNINACGTISGYVPSTTGAGSSLTGPISLGSLAAYGNVYNNTISLVLASGNNPIPLPASGPLFNVTHPTTTTVVPQVTGVYLVTYFIAPTIALGAVGVFSITVNGVSQLGSIYPVLAAQVDYSAVGQALLVLNAGDVVSLNLNSTVTITLTGVGSLTLEKIA